MVQAKAARIMDYVKSLGANAVSISFVFYTGGAGSDGVHPGEDTPSPGRMAAVVAAAHARGLNVTLRPLLDERNLLPHAWRGSFEPSNRARWFASYQRFLDPYLRMAQQAHVERFVIGTELVLLEPDPHWQELVAAARRVYHGELGYSANWASFARQAPVVRVPIGLDAYLRVPLGDDATAGQVEAAWEQKFASIHRSIDYRGLILDEVGVAAQAGAYRHPYRWSRDWLPLNTTVQERWVQAACRFAQRHQIAGMYFWKLGFDADPQHPEVADSDRGEFIGRPAASAIRACFRQR